MDDSIKDKNICTKCELTTAFEGATLPHFSVLHELWLASPSGLVPEVSPKVMLLFTLVNRLKSPGDEVHVISPRGGVKDEGIPPSPSMRVSRRANFFGFTLLERGNSDMVYLLVRSANDGAM